MRGVRNVSEHHLEDMKINYWNTIEFEIFYNKLYGMI